MRQPSQEQTDQPDVQQLMLYVTDLELEVDRLRKHAQIVRQEVRDTLRRIKRLCTDSAEADGGAPPLTEIDQAVRQLAAALRDLHEPPGYHPAHDQVIPIAVKPLVEQDFRWHQRALRASGVALRLELEGEYVEWFPARLRHILENILSNALKYRDRDKTESWVLLGLKVSPEGYEFRVSDNGIGLPPGNHADVLGLPHRAAPTRAAGLGVGLAAVKHLVEQSGGTLTVDSGEGQGSTFVVLLPRYEVDDFLS